MADFLELCKQAGLKPKRVASTNGGEYKSPCPKCGGTNRFMIWPNRQYKNCIGGFFCRQCDKGGDSIAFCRDFLGMTWNQSVEATHANVQLNPKHQRLIPKHPKSKGSISPSSTWQQRAEDLVGWAEDQIKNRIDVLEELERRGLPLEAIERFRIGYVDNPENYYGNFKIPRAQFGLKEELGKGGLPSDVWVPRGILIPSIEPSGKIVRLKVRRADYKPDDDIPKYAAIPGSMGGLNLIGNRACDAVAVVESELDGYAVSYAVGDLALVIAVGSNSKKPDSFSNLLAENARTLLICHDNDPGGETMKDKWLNMYSHAIPFPTPNNKDIGEAAEGGLDIRDWLLAGLAD